MPQSNGCNETRSGVTDGICHDPDNPAVEDGRSLWGLYEFEVSGLTVNSQFCDLARKCYQVDPDDGG